MTSDFFHATQLFYVNEGVEGETEMRLMMIAAIFLFIIPLAFGMMLFTRYKKSAIIMMLLPFFITLITSAQWVYEWNHHLVSSADSTNEAVQGLLLHEVLDQAL